jgi:hypothetical protein
MDLPLDPTIHSRMERIRSLPTLEDFSEGGQFNHLHIPFFPPVPIEILKYLYGDDVTHDRVHVKDQANLLRLIHSQIKKTATYCDCGQHIISRNRADSPFTSQDV